MQRALQQSFSHSSESTKVCNEEKESLLFIIFLNFFFILQKQYSDLFGLAAEDETSAVGRRGTSGRGRKPLQNKKDSNNTSGSSNTKKGADTNNCRLNVYSSDEESSEVSIFYLFFLLIISTLSKIL